MNRLLDTLRPNVRPITSPMSFVPQGHLLIDNEDIGIQAGELYTECVSTEIGAALLVQDWVFALTKDVGDTKWYISGFHGRFQFLLEQLETESNESLVLFVVEKITPVLLPEYIQQGTLCKWSLQKHE